MTIVYFTISRFFILEQDGIEARSNFFFQRSFHAGSLYNLSMWEKKSMWTSRENNTRGNYIDVIL